MPTPELQAQRDWAETGEFRPWQYSDKALRDRYNAEAARIQKQWDNQP